jgi:uncharacterized protein (DUF1697 family)
MVYVALLRGINVGGKNKVEMVKLKMTFEKLGFSNVKTYINSGNVIFATDSKDQPALIRQIESAIQKDFGFYVPVILRSVEEIEKFVKDLPDNWVNDQTMKCDVMFLWPEIDSPEILKRIPHNPENEDVIYLPGAVVWRIDRDNVTRGQVLRIVGTDIHKKMTIRNPNTVRKLFELMKLTF